MEPRLIPIAGFDHQVTGVTVAADGRMFVNFPRWTDDAPISVAEVVVNERLRPYPDADWNAWRNEKAGELPVDQHFVCVQSVVADRHGRLWVLDPAAPGNEKLLPGGAKLVAIDLATDQVVQVIGFADDIALQGSYLNDVRFSPDGRTAYITDSGTRGAIIVVDLDSGSSFRALDGHASTQVDKAVVISVDGRPLRRPDGRQPMFAADGIALSRDGETLYWQALTGDTLYAIDTALLGPSVKAEDAAAGVKPLGKTCVADGLWMASNGSLYLTSPSDNAIKRWTGSGLETVIRDARLRWPDTMSETPEGELVVTSSRIQDTVWFRPGAPPSLPTALFRVRPEQPVTVVPAQPMPAIAGES